MIQNALGEIKLLLRETDVLHQFVDMPLLFETASDKWFGDNILAACSETSQARYFPVLNVLPDRQCSSLLPSS